MAHIVTCYYCNGRFDRDKEPFVQVSARRYCHKRCAPKEQQIVISQEEQDYNDLIKYIEQLFKAPVLPNVIKQIKDYKQNYGYSYSGIKKTLYWFYELKRNSVKKANKMIGIVPYVYDQALDYYYHLYLGQIAAAEDSIPIPPTQKIIIQSPVCTPELKKRKPFVLEDDE